MDSKKESELTDEGYLQHFINKQKPNSKLMIYDARSEKAAQANRAIGGGFEEGFLLALFTMSSISLKLIDC